MNLIIQKKHNIILMKYQPLVLKVVGGTWVHRNGEEQVEMSLLQGAWRLFSLECEPKWAHT